MGVDHKVKYPGPTSCLLFLLPVDHLMFLRSCFPIMVDCLHSQIISPNQPFYLSCFSQVVHHKDKGRN